MRRQAAPAHRHDHSGRRTLTSTSENGVPCWNRPPKLVGPASVRVHACADPARCATRLRGRGSGGARVGCMAPAIPHLHRGQALQAARNHVPATLCRTLPRGEGRTITQRFAPRLLHLSLRRARRRKPDRRATWQLTRHDSRAPQTTSDEGGGPELVCGEACEVR